jgi:hypothetical protein
VGRDALRPGIWHHEGRVWDLQSSLIFRHGTADYSECVYVLSHTFWSTDWNLAFDDVRWWSVDSVESPGYGSSISGNLAFGDISDRRGARGLGSI